MFKELLEKISKIKRLKEEIPVEKLPYFFLYLEFFEFIKSMINRYIFDFDDFAKCFQNPPSLDEDECPAFLRDLIQ